MEICQVNYQKHYDRLIEKASQRILQGYKESHHIVPRCMGDTDDKSNLVDLTAPEHYVAHQLLAKIYPKNRGLIYACAIMTASSEGQIRNNKMFGWIRERVAKACSERHKGRKRSQATKDKMSKASKGVPKSKEHRASISKVRTGVSTIRDKIRETHLNKVVSKETLKKMSESMIKINKEVTCPWCGKVGKLTGMKSWHFDRCKENPNGLQRAV